MSAWVLRVPARDEVAAVTRNEYIGRKHRELFRDSDMVAFRKGPPSIVGAGTIVQPVSESEPAMTKMHFAECVR